MSLGGRSERVEVLRDTIARIAGEGAASFADGRQAGRVPLGRGLALDRLLRGGLARGALHEVVAAAPGDAGAASGFALALAARSQATDREQREGRVVWILEDAARAEHGAPYAPGLAAHGLDPARLVVVATAAARDSLWAMEEALKAGAGAVVAELIGVKAYDLVASRRLVLAAHKGGGVGLLVPHGGAGLAKTLSSAAATRFEVAALPSAALAAAAGRLPLPGRAGVTVRLARIRAGPAGHDPDRFWPLAWDHAEALFRDALPLAPPADAANRPTRQMAHDVAREGAHGAAQGRHAA